MSCTREDRTDTQRGAQRTLTLDDSAVASRPAGVRVSLLRWSLRYPKWPVILIASFLLSVGLSVLVDWMFVVSLPLAMIPNFFYWNRIVEHYRFGDANPGVLVRVDPPLVAVLTDMSKGGEGDWRLRVVDELPAREWGDPPVAGTRLATVGLYHEGDDDRAPSWGRFDPLTVEPVTAAAEDAVRLMESFEPEEWRRLERAADAVAPVRAGLYEVPPEALRHEA
jgi:hypothetical protein